MVAECSAARAVDIAASIIENAVNYIFHFAAQPDLVGIVAHVVANRLSHSFHCLD